MVARRTVDLLPEIFRTETNQQFLGATLDQLTQEPVIKRTQGFVGRRVGPGVNPADNYVVEPTAARSDYQLEPGVVFFRPETNKSLDAITYPGMIDAIGIQGGNTEKQDRLWEADYYAWDPFCDLDKFTNYSQYYWLPGGPDSVDVSSTVISTTDDYEVTRSPAYYNFSDIAGENPVITLVRGGNYRFNVNQPGSSFWIQAEPGISGTMPSTPNISSRGVLGVINNGEDSGTVTFNVPDKNAQDFYFGLNDIGTVDLIANASIQFNQINNLYVSEFAKAFPSGIDGITNLQGRTIVFLNQIQDAQDGGWQITSQFDPLTRTAPNQVGTSISYDLITRTVPNQVSSDISYDVTGQPYDDVPYNTITPGVIVSGSPDPQDGQPGTFDADGYGFNEPILNPVLSGSPDPLDGFPGSFDSLPYDYTQDISVDRRYGIWRINYELDNDGQAYMVLQSVQLVDNLSKFRIQFGIEYSSTQWFKNASGYFEEIPLLTAIADRLWYQDGTNPEIFGQIRLVDSADNNPIDINEIIGAKTYTSPNGVIFSNGLKVQFRGPTIPAGYQDLEYYVEGVGSGFGITARVGFIDGEAYFGPWHQFGSGRLTGSVHSEEYFQQYIYETVEESLANFGRGYPAEAPLPNFSIQNATTGNGIKLIPLSDFVTPETYTKSETIPYDFLPYDSSPYDEALNAPLVPDYITINRASRDRNPWSRSNRWFHIQVIEYTAELNNQVAVLDNDFRGKRPIIEFRPNMDLFNFGTQGKPPVNIVDFRATDALSNINGQIGYSIDGYNLIDGSRIIFAADRDPDVRNRIYEVKFIDPNNSGTPIIDLTPVAFGEALQYQTVVVLSGLSQQGKSYWFDGLDWIESQQKINVNQPPLFDIYDPDGVSYSVRSKYPSSTFAGTKLFGYAEGSTDISDPILGLSLRYLNLENVGDILFENYLYTDTFLYVEGSVSQEKHISEGFARQYINRSLFTNEIGWQDAAASARPRQVFRFSYDGEPLILDIPVDTTAIYPPVQLFQGINFIDPGQYTHEIVGQTTVITLNNPPPLGTIIEVQAISNVASQVGFYQVPLNLENNPLNENSDRFTLGTIRQHYDSIGQNLRTIVGPINGANNTRDLGNILRYGDLIVQQSAPMTLAGVFLRDRQYEIVNAIAFNSREYQKYKAIMLDLASKGNFINLTATEILDQAITEIAIPKSDVSPFYWSDMMPAGQNYTQLTYAITPITTNVFDTTRQYDYTSSNFRGMTVYLNGRILIRGYDYTVPAGTRTVVISTELTVGDTLVIREFPDTHGTFIPNTPTKMGLYPAYKPEKFLDLTYLQPTEVIRGHDGSITVAFGDFRDDVLLEFETRIFNNLKIVTPVPMVAAEVIPGQFRTTDYTLQEINEMLAPDFLSWVGWNKLDYTSQTYLANDPFTYNYSQSANKLNRQPQLGAWRGIYNNFYDTVFPNTRPWEMLGFSQQPSWWEEYYGPAPYTDGNLVLWEDLEQGLIRDPANPYVNPLYVRPDLTAVVPSAGEGELLPPLEVTTGNYDTTSWRRSWTFGDSGPVEYTWRASSAWPFAVMRLLALTKPAKFFSLFADRDRYVYDPGIGQYLWDQRYRLDSKNLEPLYGVTTQDDGVSKASFINWIIDYNRQLGVNSTQRLTDNLNNVGVRLCWRMSGFSDKRYLQLRTERSTPNNLNASLLLPDESYQLLLYKNQPFEQIAYSSVIVQSTDTGWQVYGYSTTQPYFEILTSIPNGNLTVISAGTQQVRVALDHSDDVVQVPYGYTFTNATAVCDFLVSYGLLLERQGFVFESRENGYIMNWLQMAQEFLYWSTQGWSPGAIINLNPGATRVSVTRIGAVADSLATLRPENLILNQNRAPLPSSDLVIERLGNTLRINSLTSNTINYCNFSFTAYEHLVILDNKSIFDDLIYDPITGARQSRILASGIISGDWNGTVNAPGFMLNEDNIAEWIPNRGYAKGEIVLFKNEYWSASTIIQPSLEFDYTVWIKSDYNEIQKGLLPNAANASDQLATAYSVYDAALQTETDLFSFGLIGFRPREYMQALNLDDVSQVNLYQQFLGSKGTRQSAELFSYADLGKETAQYDIYEYWAMLRSQYGATANRNYVELLLDAAKLKSNPSLVQVIESQQVSDADQTVLLENIWKTSEKLSSTNILPTISLNADSYVLPTAGYVNLDDVDFTVFDLENFDETTSTFNTSLESIGIGSTIWVAKSNAYDWNVYRVDLVPGDIVQVDDNLLGRALVSFSKEHGLVPGDYLIIRFFDPLIDGAYRISAVPSLTQVLIPFTFTGQQTTYTGEGVGFTLDTARVRQASDIVDLPYSKLINPGALVWADDDGTGHWTVYQKIQPFLDAVDIEPEPPVEQGLFGASVAQGFSNLAALVGAPATGTTGSVFTYVKTDTNEYSQNITLDLSGTTGAAGFGNAMDIGDQTWAVIGASASMSDQGMAVIIFNPPTSNAFAKAQLLIIPSGDLITAADRFGYSVTMSQDERYLYVGAPGGNVVYAYARVDVQSQSVGYVTDGFTRIFNYSNNIIITAPTQLSVVLDGVPQIYGVDYIVTSTDIEFTIAPPDGLPLDIARRPSLSAVGDGTTDTFSVSHLYGADSVGAISVYIDNALQRATYDYNLVGSDIVFVAPPALDTQIQIVATDYFKLVDTLTVPGVDPAAEFGHSVTCSTDGRQVIVGAPFAETLEGRAYIFDRNVQRFQVTNASTMSYTTDVSLSVAPILVMLNGRILLDESGNIGGQYSISGDTITFNSTVTLEVGDIIEIETNVFSLVQTIEDANPFQSARYGYSTDLCVNNCSLYVGAPYDGSELPESGHVDYQQNQSRLYGTITTQIANPSLTPGDFIRINNYYVESTGTTVQQLVDDINAATIPNVQATNVTNVTHIGDGITKTFSVGTLWSVAQTYTTRVTIDDVLQTSGVDYTYDSAAGTVTFTASVPDQSVIVFYSGRMTISVKNLAASAPANRLQVAPGTGTVFEDLGIDTFVSVQTIESPIPQAYAHFGKSIFIDTSASELVVGAPEATAINSTVFDQGTTTFDATSTQFADPIEESGAVYTFDFLRSAGSTIENPGQFVFGQQLYDANVSPLDKFGTALDYTTGTLLIGSPGEDAGDSTANYGRVVQFRNPTQEPAWRIIRQQQPVVNTELLNTIFMYDWTAGATKQYFDFFDPLQGTVLGAVRQNLNFTGAVDPAAYNVGPLNNYGQRWAQERVGQIWWNTTNARFIDPNQDDIVYASRRWGQMFPGSSVDVYQWITSDVPPALYPGPGTPKDTASYTVTSSINEEGVFATRYFYWVRGLRTVNRQARKTLSVETITRYIEDPRSSGIAYIAPINASTLAIYNGLEYITAQDTVLHVEFDEQVNESPVHVEYQLIAQDRDDGFLTPSLYQKLQDSFCGVDQRGGLVPDPFLPPSELYGVQFRPRQSMFANRFLALKNYLTTANQVMSRYPLAETRTFPLLRSQEPEPTAASDQWDKRVADYTELTYQDLNEVSFGYRYLVVSDSTNNGLWTIYQVQPGDLPGSRKLGLIRVQNYNTNLYWNFVDWYRPGYNPLTVISAEVPNYSSIDTLDLPEGSSVKVTRNGQGKFEVYLLESTGWTRVGLEDGTIAISPEIWDYSIGRFGFDVEVFDAQYFDQEPVIETRKIIQSINEEILVADLLIERNRLLILMFNFIMQEQQAPFWLTKTSLIDVDHVIRELAPFQIYRQDNQDFVLNYINEVKPYHTQIREFNLIYQGNDVYQGSLTDFDVPAYYNTTKGMFISPVLDNTTDQNLSVTSSTPSTSPIWQTFPWNQWYQNYLLEIESVNIVDGGSGYTVPPEVVITGECITPAEMIARVNSAGKVVEIIIVNPGYGYTTTALIELTGGNGTGARAAAVMGNGLVRDIRTFIKYDRYQYSSDILEWRAGQNYDNGIMVRYDNRVWSANSDDSTGVQSSSFDPSQWSLVDASTLSGVDRTMGFYTPRVNEPGLDLAQLITGVDYPGVQVSAPTFSQNTGFDVGNYDINPFDNISFGPEGQPTYDPAILDAIYESEFTDPFLGTLPAPAYAGDPPTGGPNPIIVSGGAFVDTYSSHAPEELVPGAIYDTLDFRVYTTPGSDWQGDGHGFAITDLNYIYDSTESDYSFAGLVEFPAGISIYNETIGVMLDLGVQYTLDWVNQQVIITAGTVPDGHVIALEVYGLGGGNQIYRNTYNGADVGNTIVLPVNYYQSGNIPAISEIAVFVNGQQVTNFVYAQYQQFSTQITFSTVWTASDFIVVTVLGPTTAPQKSWSTPIDQYFVANGVTFSYQLSNSLQGTNPANIIVTKNGVRARPAEGVEYIADGSSLQYYLPNRGGYSQGLIADNEVSVYIDNVPLTLGTQFLVDPWDGFTPRSISLTTLPDPGAVILISVNTAASYYLSGSTLIWRQSSGFVPIQGDVIAVTTFNDTSEQNILTQVFVGPDTQGLLISEGYDTTDYDVGNITGDPGSFDYSAGSVIQLNVFDTGRPIIDSSRIQVTLNGVFLFANEDYVVDGTQIEILGPPISATDVVAITSYTQSTVPGEIAFRIFQDMRGTQTSYKMSVSSTAILAYPLTATADTIYVDDVTKLGTPNLPEGIFGQITIDGERITYREVDYQYNALLGLRRGVAGTGADSHSMGALVYDISLGNILPAEYQDRVLAQNYLADGTTTIFVVEDFDADGVPAGELDEAVRVFVGGILQTGTYTITNDSPITVTFTTAPTAGYQVSIRIRRGLSWYTPGPGTASDGVPLQEQNTRAARFIRGH